MNLKRNCNVENFIKIVASIIEVSIEEKKAVELMIEITICDDFATISKILRRISTRNQSFQHEIFARLN